MYTIVTVERNQTLAKPAACMSVISVLLQKLTIKGAATMQGHALVGVGEERKRASHLSFYFSTGISFIPLAGGGDPWRLES